MSGAIPRSTLEKFSTFGDLLRFLRRRAGITQMELSIAVGYSDSQISRLEQNLRLPDIPTIQARFVSALGLEDEPAAVSKLLELAANVRREDAPGLGICPYKGLNFFDEADADLFVGREALTNRLVERVLALTAKSETGSERFLAVVGASGSGKSSLVRAGLAPALRWHPSSANWPIYILTPTAHPLESLAISLLESASSPAATAALIDDLAREPRSLSLFLKRALKSEYAAHNLLVVVDQFEELFALCRSEGERTAFLDNLLTAACETDGPMLAVITLRADFYAHCAGYPGLRQALAGQQEYIGAMSAEELRRAIEEPARRGRWEIEAGLVDLLLHDVGADAGHPAEPGALPLLSHALLETWQRRRGRTLTLSGYTSSGGVRGAIAETAEAVVADRFTQAQQAIARRIFLRLTELGDEIAAGDTRRRATFSELILKPEEAGETQAVLKALADARLIITHEDSAEVAHEALIREWPTLRGWLEDNREDLRLHRHLTGAAQEWLTANREPDGLYRGARLAQANEWAATHAEEMNPLEREFLEASTAFAEREAAEREAQRQRELEAAQRLFEAEKQRAGEQARTAGQLRKRAWYLAGALLIALGMAFTALFFSTQARRTAITAQEHERVAFTRELAAAALSNLEVDPERSILLALESVTSAAALENPHMPEVEDALRRALLASRVELSLRGHEGPVWAVAYSPDGRRLATASEDGTAKIWDAASGQELLTISTGNIIPKSDPFGITFSPDGSRLATPGAGGNAIVWDVISGEELLTLRGFHSVVNGIAYGPDGKLLATAGDDGYTIVWDARTGQELHRLRGKSGRLRSVALSPDGTRLAAGEDDGTVILWDVVTGEELFTLSVFDQKVVGASFSPDGARLATTAGHGTIKIWDVATGEELLTLRGHTGWIESVSFNASGARLATASDDGTAKVWDSLTGQELFTLSGHTGPVYSAVFSPDCAPSAPNGLVIPCGARLATASKDGTARVWNASFSRELATFDFDNDASRGYSPDGSRLATGFHDGTLKLWDISSALNIGAGTTLESVKELWSVNGHDGTVNQIAFSPDGARLATTSLFDNTAKVWDAATGQELLTLRGHAGGVYAVAFSPDGGRLATSSTDQTVKVWDLAGATDRALLILSASPWSTGLAFSPDGARLAAGIEAPYAKVWDTATGQVLLTLKGHDSFVWKVDFSPDGTRLATASQDQTAKLWDAVTGQELQTLQGHTARTNSLAFSPDGTRLATGSWDGTARVWDASTGEELQVLSGHTDEIWDLDWSPDGSRLITGGNGSIRIYLLQLDDLVALARSRVTRSLSEAECQDYLHISEEQCQEGTEMK